MDIAVVGIAGVDVEVRAAEAQRLDEMHFKHQQAVRAVTMPKGLRLTCSPVTETRRVSRVTRLALWT
jgi:hypothetical protein